MPESPESALVPTTLDLLANITPTTYPPSEYPGVTFVATDAPKTFTSNGTILIEVAGVPTPQATFGTGELGAVEISVTDDSFNGVHDYTTFKLDAGARLSCSAGRALVIRATESIVIDGELNVAGVNQPGGGSGFSFFYGSGATSGAGGGGGGGGDALGHTGSQGQSNSNGDTHVGLGFLQPTQGAGGAGGNGGNGSGPLPFPGGPGGAGAIGTLGAPDPSFVDTQQVYPSLLAEFLSGGLVGQQGQDGVSGGDGASNPGSGGAPGTGGTPGNGAGLILLCAPSITIGPTASIHAFGEGGGGGAPGTNGADAPGGSGGGGGGGGGGGSGGQGGSGGVMLCCYQGPSGLLVDPLATKIFFAGPGGAGAAGGTGGAPDVAGTAGGAGGAGAAGIPGTPGQLVAVEIIP